MLFFILSNRCSWYSSFYCGYSNHFIIIDGDRHENVYHWRSRGSCGTLKRVVWYFEEGRLVLWRGSAGTLKRVMQYFEYARVVLWRVSCGTLSLSMSAVMYWYVTRKLIFLSTTHVFLCWFIQNVVASRNRERKFRLFSESYLYWKRFVSCHWIHSIRC